MGSLSHMTGAISGAVIKGPFSSSDVSSLHSSGAQKVINYEQAFVLNSAEASVARANGWLALTCSGEEIHEHDLQAPERQAEDNSVIQVSNALDADVWAKCDSANDAACVSAFAEVESTRNYLNVVD
jgi:hypothetical protein